MCDAHPSRRCLANAVVRAVLQVVGFDLVQEREDVFIFKSRVVAPGHVPDYVSFVFPDEDEHFHEPHLFLVLEAVGVRADVLADAIDQNGGVL